MLRRPMHWHRLVAIVLAACAGVATGVEGDWPQFRGPGGDGLAAKTADPPVEWSKEKNITWKVRIPGRGRSSPVILGKRIWLTMAAERGVQRKRIGPDDMQTAEHVTIGAVCVDRATGKILWQVTLFDVAKPDPVHWLNSWATPTPVVESGRLYCDFGTFGTACLDAGTGKLIWKRRLPLDHQVGPGSSPVLHGERLVLVRDGRDTQYITALDKSNGRTVWKTNRPPLKASSTSYLKSFSTPLVISSGGRTQMIVPGAQWIVSYDPASGKEIWRARHGRGFSLSSRPVVAHGMVYFTTGAVRGQLWAIRIDGRGDVTGTHVAWKATRQIPVISSPIVVGNEIYWVSDRGTASCVDARSGKLIWQQRLGGHYLASPLCAGGRLYFLNAEGTTTVLKAGRQFAPIATNLLQGPVMATPAMVGRTLFLRNDTHLYRIERLKAGAGR